MFRAFAKIEQLDWKKIIYLSHFGDKVKHSLFSGLGMRYENNTKYIGTKNQELANFVS